MLARVIPAEGRIAGLYQRAARDGRPNSRSADAGSSTCTVSTRISRCWRPPSSARCSIGSRAPRPPTALATLRTARTTARGLAAELATLGGDERSRAREVDLLRYQLDEIDAAGIADGGEDDRLLAEAELLADAEAHREALATAYRELEGAGEDALGAAVAALAGRAPFAALAQRLRLLQADMQEAAHDVRTTEESIIADPQRLQAVQTRRALLAELKRKYGKTLADVVEYALETRTRLEELETHDARAAALEAARREPPWPMPRRPRARLSKARRAAAPKLAAAVTAASPRARAAGRDVHDRYHRRR